MGYTKKEFARVYHSTERIEFVGNMACCVCMRRRGCENHHVKNGGIGRKADYIWIVPLCTWCHRAYHQIGKLSMLQKVMRTSRGLVVHSGKRDGGRRRAQYFDQWDDAALAVERIWKSRNPPGFTG